MSKFANRHPWQPGRISSASVRGQLCALPIDERERVIKTRLAQYDLALEGQPEEVRNLAMEMLEALAAIVDNKPNLEVVNAMVCAAAMLLMASSPLDFFELGLSWASDRFAEMALRAQGAAT